MKELRRRDDRRGRSRSPPPRQGIRGLGTDKKLQRECDESFRSIRDQCDDMDRNDKQQHHLKSFNPPRGRDKSRYISGTCNVKAKLPTVDISTIDPDNEMAIMEAMGFSGFDSTKVQFAIVKSYLQLLYIGKACHRKCA